MNGLLIRAAGAGKTYGSREVLRNASVSLSRGEVLGIIGSSGSGKTTLLKILAGVEKPDCGDVAHFGTRGLVFQELNLWPHLTVKENVALPLVKALKLGRAVAEGKARKVLEELAISHLAGAFPQSLSGGEAQRVAIARVLALEPDAVLLDEATSALSQELSAQVAETVLKLAASGKGVAIVSHDLNLIAQVAHRVIVLDEGSIAEEGRVHDLLGKPSSEAAKRLVMESLPGSACFKLVRSNASYVAR
ncbi:MAG: ATP-binding cassette domain-containing protein [Candidatus Micrarchaeota archaeon]